ncbi:MAG: hypothetical protein P4M11_09305 [Candidatus Pacebacteria bacterium]|nr:hypothetical protein [Candidatus Paceibacterota bacterium]
MMSHQDSWLIAIRDVVLSGKGFAAFTVLVVLLVGKIVYGSHITARYIRAKLRETERMRQLGEEFKRRGEDERGKID